MDIFGRQCQEKRKNNMRIREDTKMEELISIIIPVYNVEKYIDRCMETVLNQTYRKMEIILVDDGSPDRCGKICDEYAEKDHRVRVLHKENGGLSSARNAGLKLAKGEYVLFVDSDDWIELDMVEQLYDLLKKNPNVQIAQCAVDIAHNSTDLLKQPKVNVTIKEKSELLGEFYRVHRWKYNTAVWNKLIRASVLKNFEFVLTLNEDVEASLEFIMRTDKWIETNQILYHYFLNDNGITRRKFSSADLDYLNVWDRVVKITEMQYPEYLIYAQKLRIRAEYTLLSKMFLRGYNRDDKQMIEIKKRIKTNVRHNFWKMLSWNMPISRKVLLIFIVI